MRHDGGAKDFFLWKVDIFFDNDCSVDGGRLRNRPDQMFVSRKLKWHLLYHIRRYVYNRLYLSKIILTLYAEYLRFFFRIVAPATVPERAPTRRTPTPPTELARVNHRRRRRRSPRLASRWCDRRAASITTTIKVIIIITYSPPERFHARTTRPLSCTLWQCDVPRAVAAIGSRVIFRRVPPAKSPGKSAPR